MSKTDLTLNLIRYRFTRNGVNLGMSVGEAAIMAEQRMKNEGLFGFLKSMRGMGTPEGAIVSIVETFLTAIVQQLLDEPHVAKMESNAPEKVAALTRHTELAFQKIEDHRKRLGGIPNFPRQIHDYVAYRMQIEMTALHGVDADAMGLDREATDNMVQEAIAYFRPRLGEMRHGR